MDETALPKNTDVINIIKYFHYYLNKEFTVLNNKYNKYHQNNEKQLISFYRIILVTLKFHPINNITAYKIIEYQL